MQHRFAPLGSFIARSLEIANRCCAQSLSPRGIFGGAVEFQYCASSAGEARPFAKLQNNNVLILSVDDADRSVSQGLEDAVVLQDTDRTPGLRLRRWLRSFSQRTSDCPRIQSGFG